LLPEVNREPNWRMALLVFAGVAMLLILQHLVGVWGLPDIVEFFELGVRQPGRPGALQDV